MADDNRAVAERLEALKKAAVEVLSAIERLRTEDAESARGGLLAIAEIADPPGPLATIPVPFDRPKTRTPMQVAKAVGDEIDAILEAVGGPGAASEHSGWIDSVKTASLWFCEF